MRDFAAKFSTAFLNCAALWQQEISPHWVGMKTGLQLPFQLHMSITQYTKAKHERDGFLGHSCPVQKNGTGFLSNLVTVLICR